MEKKKRHIEAGTPQPDPKYHIEITPDGPYLVYGSPHLQQEILEMNEENIPWQYAKGDEYSTENEPTALCRCGHSHNHPYCDGSHTTANWDPTLTADDRPLLEMPTYTTALPYNWRTIPIIAFMPGFVWPAEACGN